MIQEANDIFTKVFNILVGNLIIIQNSFHSCLPFPIFFVLSIMVICYDGLVSFKLTSKNLTQTLILSIAYWVAFDMACRKHNPTNGHVNLREKQKTTKINAEVNLYFSYTIHLWCMQLICQINQRYLTIFFHNLQWLHLECYVPQKSQLSHGCAPMRC